MRGRLALWLRAQIELGVFETKADISAFVLNTVLVATTLATSTYLMVAAILAHFGLLPYPLRSAIGFGGSTTIVIAASITALLAWLIGTAIHELSLSRAEFERRSRLDALSGLYNRQAFTDALSQTKENGFFVMFDVEAVFIFPWATRLEAYVVFGLVEMVVFIIVLALGLVYAWRKGVLRWI